jgi:hypothetical protein
MAGKRQGRFDWTRMVVLVVVDIEKTGRRRDHASIRNGDVW